MERQHRKEHIDVLRGIGILLMIMGHVGFGGKFDRYIHAFHMPLFFLISGYLYNAKTDMNLTTILQEKIKRFLIPYVLFGILNYFFWILIEKKDQFILKPVISLVWNNTQGLPICGAIWFLTALFWTSIFYVYIDRSIRSITYKNIICFGIPFILTVLQSISDLSLPLGIDIGIVGVGFYHIGRLFRNIECKIRRRITVKPGISLIFLAVLFLINGTITFLTPYINMKMRWYGLAPVFWINALIGTSVFYVFSVILIESSFVHRFEFVKRSLAYVGRESLVFLGFNQLAILLLEVLFEWLNVSSVFPWILIATVKSLGAVAMLAYSANYINKGIRLFVKK